jgi:hypothetical protein
VEVVFKEELTEIVRTFEAVGPLVGNAVKCSQLLKLQAELTKPESDILCERDVVIPMSENVSVTANIFRSIRVPEMDQKVPVVARTLALVPVLLLIACTTKFDPEATGYLKPPEEVGFIDRALVERNGDVTVRVAALSAEESKAIFGVPLAQDRVQPVWVEVQNESDQHYVFFPIDLDPDYFSSFELAWKYRYSNAEEALRQIGQHFEQYQMPFFVAPRETVSGFVYANKDQGAKAVAIDLVGEDHDVKTFEFVVKVPGLKADYFEKDWDAMLSDTQFVDLDTEELRKLLEKLPCCTLGGDRKTPGDPLNIVVISKIEDDELLFPFVRRGWDLTETAHTASMWNTIKSSLFRSQYRYSPVSPLYVFERPQDIALQKARASVDERNHLRLWMSPYRYRGMPVFVGQISRDIGVRFSSKTFVTHKIDPDVDEAREYLSQDLFKSRQVAKIGYVTGVGALEPSAPRYNYTGDPYWTDGLRAVYVLVDDLVPLEELEHFDWEWPSHTRRLGGQ